MSAITGRTTAVDRPRPAGASRTISWPIAGVIGAVAAVVAFFAIQAWRAGTNDPDSMASVLYFERLLSGRHLELTVLTTPKPLLTALYGMTWGLFHDWRTIVWETALVHGLSVALAARLASRAAGIAAGLFVAAALIASAPELAEVAQANSLPWALAGWLAAGVALTERPRRPWLAGAALLLAGMVRIETWLILGAGSAAIALMALPALRARARDWPTAASIAPLLLGWLAVPVQLGHDALLTGNPLYWLSVPNAYTALVQPDLQPISPQHFARLVFERYLDMPVLVVLAIVGAVFLVTTRRWTLLVGLGGLVGGGLILIGSLAVRAIFVSSRYFEEPDLGLLVAAAIGAGAIVASLIPARSGTNRWWRVGVGGVAAAVLAVLISLPGPLTTELADRFAAQRAASANLEAVLPALRMISKKAGPAPAAVAATGGFTEVDLRRASMYVPRPLLRRVAIELGIELTWIGDPYVASGRGDAADLLVPGQYVYHDANVDGPPEWFAPFETEAPATLGSLRLVPIAYASGEYWLIQIDAASP